LTDFSTGEKLGVSEGIYIIKRLPPHTAGVLIAKPVLK
jgi:hypothetical protein